MGPIRPIGPVQSLQFHPHGGRTLTEKTIRILARMPNWLGDCVMATPALRRLRELFPEAEILLAGRRPFRGLFAAQPGVAGFVEAPGGGFGNLLRGLASAKASVHRAASGGVDVGILFTNSFSTAAWLRCAGAGIRVGYNLDCRRLLLSHPVPCGAAERAAHFIRYYLRLAEAAGDAAETAGLRRKGGASPSPADAALPFPEVRVGDAARNAAAGLLRSAGVSGSYAVLAPASAYGPVKDWPPEHYRVLAEALWRDFGLPAVVTGGAGQAEVCAGIAAGLDSSVSLAGQTGLEDFAALLAGAALFVGGDSGGAHVAAALGVPTLVIFGVTNPSRTRPTGPRVRELGCGRNHDVKLDSAEARAAAARELAAIAPESVRAAAADMLEKRGV